MALLSSQRSLVGPTQRSVAKPFSSHLISGSACSRSQLAREVPCKARHGKTVIARSHEVEIDYSTDLEDADRADEVRIQMAKAMNATVVRFTVPEYKTSPGNWLSIVGSVDELGSWTAGKGARMKWLPGHEWVADVILPQNYSGCFEYKLVLMNEKGMCVWEPGTNRKLQVAGNFSNEQPQIEVSLQWGLREEEIICDSELEFPSAMLEAMYERAEQAVKAMPGINAATVLLQAQQQLAQSKKIHKQQVTSLRAQLVALQQSSQRETNRVQTRMRELERAMETIHTRLEQERMISEKHIELLQVQIQDLKTKKAEEDANEEAGAAHPAPAGIAAYEPHVMALLPNYSGLSLDRLHNMLGQCVFTPKYKNQDAAELEQLLDHLVAAKKITKDNGVYRFKSRGTTTAATRRARTPSPRHTAAAPRAVVEEAKATLTPQIVALEPKVLSCLDSAGALPDGVGIPIERIAGQMAIEHPDTECGYDELSLLMDYLEAQGKVKRERDLYWHARAPTRTLTPTQAVQRRASTPAPQRVAPRPVAPPRPRGRTFSDGEEEYSAPVGSVAGGPPGSQPEPVSGGSIMPAFDSTGAHPTLDSVSKYEKPILSVLERHGPQSMDRLCDLIGSEFLEFSHCTLHDIVPVLKNLIDQHKVAEGSSGEIAFLHH